MVLPEVGSTAMVYPITAVFDPGVRVFQLPVNCTPEEGRKFTVMALAGNVPPTVKLLKILSPAITGVPLLIKSCSVTAWACCVTAAKPSAPTTPSTLLYDMWSPKKYV